MQKEVLKAVLKKQLCFLNYKNLEFSVGEKNIFIFLDANKRPKFNIFLGKLGEFSVWVVIEDGENVVMFEVLEKMRERILNALNDKVECHTAPLCHTEQSEVYAHLCHTERSEVSQRVVYEIFRYAQNDKGEAQNDKVTTKGDL